MDTPELKTIIADWITKARNVLVDLGLQVKEMTRFAHLLATSAAQSREMLQTLSKTHTDLHGLVLKIEAAAAEGREKSDEFRKLLTELADLSERSTLEVDAAFHSYDDVFRVTTEMSGYITKTTQTLLQEAQMMQELKARVGGSAEKSS